MKSGKFFSSDFDFEDCEFFKKKHLKFVGFRKLEFEKIKR